MRFWNNIFHTSSSELRLDSELTKIRQLNGAFNTEFNYVMKHQGNGIQYEKDGNLDAAIKSYTEAYSYGLKSKILRWNNYVHSMERLSIIFRKLKRYDDEIDIIQKMLNIVTDDSKLIERLNQRLVKATLLKAKSNP